MLFLAHAPSYTRAQAPAALQEAKALAVGRAPQAKRRLLELVKAEREPASRAKLAAIFSALPTKQMAAADFDALLADPEAQVRLSAIAGLGQVEGAAARSRLERVLADEPSAGVRMAAAFWLGRPEHARSAPALEAALTRDADANVRVSAAQALSRIGTSRARRGLRRGTRDADARVRRLAR